MKPYDKYCEDIISGKITASIYIKQAVERFIAFKNRPDIMFDEEAVDRCILFISKMKHFKGKTAGQNFILSPWQQFIVANIIGLKWKDTGYRVCREVYLQVSRKAGKDALIAAIALYCLVADGEAAPEIACLANSREQTTILFEYIDKFAHSLDPKEQAIKHYKKYVELPANNGVCKTYSADSSKLDGLNISVGVCDEFHEQKNSRLYDVIKSSQAMRAQPLMIIITTAGFNLESPCYAKYILGIEVLNGTKTDDTFFPFLYVLDVEDDWTEERNWIKCQPNLDVTVTREFMRSEVQKAKNDSTAVTGILTKTFNKWLQSGTQWIPPEVIAKLMTPVNLEDYGGMVAYLGVDLSSVGDFTSLSVMIPVVDKYVFKSWCFLPEETFKTHQNHDLYDRFVKEGTMIITPGNTCDYDYIISKIKELSEILIVEGVYYDQWNSSFFVIKCTEEGYNMIPVSQSIGNFNAPTKEMERIIKDHKVVIDKSMNILYQFQNVSLKIDLNGNIKPTKENYNKKIDSCISMIMALAGYMKNPMGDNDIIFIK